MKRTLLAVAALAFSACSLFSAPPSATPTENPTPSAPSPTPSSQPVCQSMAHVYHPDRLQVLAPCVSLTGTVEIIRPEADGDQHILVRVDANQPDPSGGQWINAVNVSKQQGDLVVEPVCVGVVIQPDAVDACAGYTNPTALPAVGDHVRVTGPWVLDTLHGWNEIHPAVFEAA